MVADDAECKEESITRYVLNIVDEEHGKKYSVPVDAFKKIIDVKTDMYACTDIKVSQQLWSGWPVFCPSDDLMLSQLGLTEPVLELKIRAAPVSVSSNPSVERNANKVSKCLATWFRYVFNYEFVSLQRFIVVVVAVVVIEYGGRRIFVRRRRILHGAHHGNR